MDNDDFFSACINAIELSSKTCDCKNHWHYFWPTLKAAGLRRGIYLQRPIFEEFLQDRISKKQSILIAGSADSGTLEVLHDILKNVNNEYYAIDQCPTPLLLLSEYSKLNNINLETKISDISEKQSNKFDIILVHNTLVFSSKKHRLDTLTNFASHLNEGGIIICGMRYNTKYLFSELDFEFEKIKMLDLIESTFKNQPLLRELLFKKVDPYIHSQLISMTQRVQQDDFHSEINLSGLKIKHSRVDQMILPSMTSKINNRLDITAELLLLNNLQKSS